MARKRTRQVNSGRRVLTSRQRKLWAAGISAAAFAVLAAVVAWRMLAHQAAYRPGEGVEGLTAELARTLPPDYPRVTFTDVTTSAGIRTDDPPWRRTSQLPEDMGSGAAWGDYDDDGWLDLAIASEVGPLDMTDAQRAASPRRARLYHNNHDGTFADVTDAAGITFRGWGMAAAWADYDNDGRLDLLLTAYGHNVLYHNDGNGRFSDRSAASGIGAAEGYWSGAAWGDYDRDGLLDLYITGYVKYSRQPNATAPGVIDIENPASINPASFPGERNLLFHNTGHGTFTERAVAAGVDNPQGRGLSASWVDLDDDGWLDLYVGNDVSDNLLYRNRHDGSFADISHSSRLADYRSSMGIAIGDWNGDGRQDVFLTHWLAQGNALYDNVPPLGPRTAKSSPVSFVDESDRYGLGQISLDFIGWGTSFLDYDLDGKLDLFVVNGSTLQRRDDPSQLAPMRSQLFWNRGPQEGFFDVSAVAGDFFKRLLNGRGAAFGDYDNDGDVDVLVTTNGAPPHLLRNDGGTQNHWLQVDLRGTKSNHFGLGARLRVVAHGVSQLRQVGAQASYLSQNSAVETFGLGAAQLADTIEVRWLGGTRDVRTGVRANQRLRIVEGEAAAVSDRAGVDKFWAIMREATTYRINGDYARALESYERALALNPRHGDALYYAGTMQLELGKYAEAAGSWRRQLASDPSSARAFSQLGALFLCTGGDGPLIPDSADAYFQRAHEINKEETGPLLRLGESALVRGDLARAKQYVQTVLSTHATSAPAHFYSGYFAFKAGNVAAAEQEFEKSRALPVAAVVAGATNEGDLRPSGALRQVSQRCAALRRLSEERTKSPMRDAYRRLDSLLAVARRRVR